MKNERIELDTYYLLDCRAPKNTFKLMTHAGDVWLQPWQGWLLLQLCRRGRLTNQEVANIFSHFTECSSARVHTKIDELRRKIAMADENQETIVFDRSLQAYVWETGLLVSVARSDQLI